MVQILKNNKCGIRLILIAGVVAFLYMTGIPSIYLPSISIVDVEPTYITLLMNMLLVILIGVMLVKGVTPEVKLEFGRNNLKQGFSDYWFSCLIAFMIPCIVFYLDLRPLEYKPTIWKLIIEGFLYYIGVGITEEFFSRGLLLNGIEKLLKGNKTQLKAVMLSALIFGLGHIFGIIGATPYYIISKVIWTIGLGIYLGAIYVKTRNLWIVAFFHIIIDLGALPFCFSLQMEYSKNSALIIMLTFLFMGGYGIYLLREE